MITAALWFIAFTLIAISVVKTRHWRENQELHEQAVGYLFCIMVGLTFWVTTTYVLWGFGINLDVKTIKDGLMPEHWWLPPATILFTTVCYYSAKPKISE